MDLIAGLRDAGYQNASNNAGNDDRKTH